MDVHPKERKPRHRRPAPDERALIERILGRGLVDVHRTLDPDNADLFTWWAPWRNMKQRNIGWRLDYVFASEALASRATSCVVQREFGTSDHGPVIAVFDVVGGCCQVSRQDRAGQTSRLAPPDQAASPRSSPTAR